MSPMNSQLSSQTKREKVFALIDSLRHKELCPDKAIVNYLWLTGIVKYEDRWVWLQRYYTQRDSN